MPEDGDPDKNADTARAAKDKQTPTLSATRNKELAKRVEQFPELKDFYNSYDPLDVTPESRSAYQRMLKDLTEEERKLIQTKTNYYSISLKNVGGLVMPVILRLTYDDDSQEIIRLPAEIWAKDSQSARTSVLSAKVLKSVELDPFRETADAYRDNNYFPPRFEPSRFQLYKAGERGGERDNPMRAANRRAEKLKKDAEAKAAKESKAVKDAEDKKAKQGKETKEEAEEPSEEPAASDEKPEQPQDDNQDADDE